MAPLHRRRNAARAASPLASCLVLLAASACTTDPTQLVVLVSTDWLVPDELGFVRAVVKDPAGRVQDRREFVLERSTDVPFSFAVVPRDSDVSRRVTIEVEGYTVRGTPAAAGSSCAEGDPPCLVTTRRTTGFREHVTLLVPIEIARHCANEALRDACTGTTTCGSDGCRPVLLEPSRLTSIRPGDETRVDASVTRPDGGEGPLDCETNGDRDGDRHLDLRCEGGDDCDDTNPVVYPGAEEVCDPGNVDEDCDPLTIGSRDADDDSFVDVDCCNGESCGDDCNDDDANVRPDAPETCNGVDDDCDGTTDGPRATAACAEVPNATSECVAGRCALVACGPDRFADCNDSYGDGCEEDTSSSRAHCGECDAGCDVAGQTCAAGRCDSIVGITGGQTHTCVVFASGRAACRGANASGQLGDGSTTMRSAFVAVTGLDDAVQIVAGEGHTCARRTSGAVACWGTNVEGQLGRGSVGEATSSSSPVAVSGLSDAVDIAAGAKHTCAIRMGGAVVCWGDDASFALGDGDGARTDRGAPAPVVPAFSNARQITAGLGHTCVLRTSGACDCWGQNDAGQVGDGTAMIRDAPTSVALPGGMSALEIRAGSVHTCARLADESLHCWGRNVTGRLGDGTDLDRRLPTRVTTVAAFAAVAPGGEYTCGVQTGGRVHCWGFNAAGMLGTGDTMDSLEPVAVVGLDYAVSIGAGFTEACAVRRGSGELWCWGRGVATAMRILDLP